MGAASLLEGTYDLYIDGKWVKPKGGRFADISPSTEESVADAPDGDLAQMVSAVAAARVAFDDGRWSGLSAGDRSKCLVQLGEALLAHAEDFFSLARSEWGCTENERLFQIDGPAFMALHAAELCAEPTETQVDFYGAAGKSLLRHVPLGVVSILTPWNFPHVINVMKVVSALAAGNTLVLKPSPLTPIAGLALAKIIDEETDIPSGVVNVVATQSLEASKFLTTDHRIDMVSFTGSTSIGHEVMAAAGGTMKRLLLECGGKSASIVLDANAVKGELPRILFEACSLHAGQACILHSRLLLPEDAHDDIVAELVDLAKEIKIGDPFDSATEMGPLISDGQRQRVEAHVADAVSDGARVVAGGVRPGEQRIGYYFKPTIIDGVEQDSRIAQEEVFGPVLSILKYRSVEEAVAIANNSVYGLSGAVWGTDVDQCVEVARSIRTGQVAINGVGPGDAPFGGFKQSGIGREGGISGLQQYMETQAIGVPT